jgi:mannose-1-phosphate guanylyltransferase
VMPRKQVQFGIVPSYASNQLGYIKKGVSGQYGGSVYEIESWKYQPDQDTANEWYETGHFLWNAGYFISTMEYVQCEIKRESPDSFAAFEAIDSATDEDLEDTYNHQEPAILDHVLSEKMKNAQVVACTFDWIDIGNFNDLHSVSPHDADGIFIRGDVTQLDMTDCYISNELDIPMAVVGLDNIVVIATENGILVANKSQSKKVGDVAKKIQG